MTNEQPTDPKPTILHMAIAVTLGPLLALLTLGTEGVLALCLPHALLGALLLVSRLTAWRAAALAAITGGVLGTFFSAMTHPPGERRYVASFVLFASLLAPVGAAIGAYRHGYRRLGKTVLIAIGLILVLVMLVVLTHPGGDAIPKEP